MKLHRTASTIAFALGLLGTSLAPAQPATGAPASSSTDPTTVIESGPPAPGKPQYWCVTTALRARCAVPPSMPKRRTHAHATRTLPTTSNQCFRISPITRATFLPFNDRVSLGFRTRYLLPASLAAVFASALASALAPVLACTYRLCAKTRTALARNATVPTGHAPNVTINPGPLFIAAATAGRSGWCCHPSHTSLANDTAPTSTDTSAAPSHPDALSRGALSPCQR